MKNNYIKYTTYGFQLIAAVLIGVLVGQWLDKKYDSQNNLYTIILSLVMIVATLYSLIREFLKENKD